MQPDRLITVKSYEYHKSQAILLFVQQVFQTNNNTSEAHTTGLWWKESSGDQWIPLTNGQESVMQTVFQCHDAIMWL